MPSKKDRPSKSKKKNAGSAGSDNQEEPQNIGMQQSLQLNNPVVSRLSGNEASPHYHPAYRDEGGYPMSNYPPSGPSNFPPMQPHQSFPSASPNVNGSTLMNNSSPSQTPSPASFSSSSRGGGQIMENGYSHSSPVPSQPSPVPNPSNFPANSSAEKESYFSKVLDSNAHLILRINQAMADNQPEVVGELMQALSKNIQTLSGASTPQQASSPTDVATTSSSYARISQSPLPVRPSSAAAPSPYPYPGTSSQAPSYSNQNGPPSFQPQQGRPQPVYSPLTQSTHGGAFPPRSPSLQSFQQPHQMVNGYVQPPNRSGQQPTQQYSQPAPQQQQQQQQLQQQPTMQQQSSPYGSPQAHPSTTQQHPPQQQGQMSNMSMPPPQNYPYHPNQSRSMSTPQGYPASAHPNYPPQQDTSPMDPNYSLMPPPQMHPRRSSSSNNSYRPTTSSHPSQGQMIGQQQQQPQAPPQMAYQQQQQHPLGYPPQQAQQQQQQQHQQYAQYQQSPQQGQPNHGVHGVYYGNVPSSQQQQQQQQQQYNPMSQYKPGQPTGPPYDSHGNATGS